MGIAGVAVGGRTRWSTPIHKRNALGGLGGEMTSESRTWVCVNIDNDFKALIDAHTKAALYTKGTRWAFPEGSNRPPRVGPAGAPQMRQDASGASGIARVGEVCGKYPAGFLLGSGLID